MPLHDFVSSASFLLPLHREISAKAYLDESEALYAMLEHLTFLEAIDGEITEETRKLIEALREGGTGGGIEAFLQEYGLDSSEGVAVMCLAEALLRIPDAETADRLIHDKFVQGNWEQHLGHSDSFLVNASSWGLLLTGKIVHLNDTGGPAALIAKLVGKLGEPVVREALKASMRIIGSQFVLGENTKEALDRARPFAKKGYRFSYDILGEGARSQLQAERYTEAYREAIALIGAQAKNASLLENPGISVKLSALHPRYQLIQHERVMKELLPRLKSILLQAKEHDIAVSIDAEESSRLDIEMLIFSEIFADPAFAGWNGIGFVLQAYSRRAFYIIDYLGELARHFNRKMPLRLVKGAYWDSEIKAAQVSGLPSYPVFTRKSHTDISYFACAAKILRRFDCFFPQFATHNARTLATIQAMAKYYHVGKGEFEFQRLHGMGERLYEIAGGGHPCRIYAPIGEHKDLLAYLIRRLLENGANTSFVNLLMDSEIPLGELIQDPLASARAAGLRPNAKIPAPLSIYGSRRNSAGVDWGNLVACEALEQKLAGYAGSLWRAEPLLAHDTNEGAGRTVHDPADLKKPTGKVREAREADVADAITTAQAAAIGWAATPVAKRAAMLEAAADAIEANAPELIALIAREAGRTIPDGLSEVREAADFCRYYASQARLYLQPLGLSGPTGESNRLHLHPRGIVGCISPWNFPLSIFTGQVAAALATGNCVLAKPAEQSPLIAALAVRLLHQAGIPRGVLQLLTGPGAIGEAIVADARVGAIAFTGSVEVAQHINRRLAARDGALAAFVAETGGQNCMVVDSSALLEQAVDDIVISAFGSAGQRCSSLRVLYVQEDIADALLGLLKGAMQELSLGHPLQLATDIGPVIDSEARDKLIDHIHQMRASATLIAETPLSDALMESGYFIAPHAFEISSIHALKKEVFGPVLHVIRFKADELERVASDINSTGYGLTFGIQSRIEEHAAFFTSRVKAGNMYVNRSMIGAVVGVQPFGGEGLSGTGPKAGGPHYLLKFLTERTVTVNTTAIGGNLALLAED